MSLYERHNYLNKNVDYIINHEIIEYDIKSAGYNIIRRYDLLPESKINILSSMNKKDRQIYIGKEIIKNKTLASSINAGFVSVRKLFLESNDVNDEEVLSIKKDAIFLHRRVSKTEFDNIEFIEKNVYTSYYNLNRKEFYYNSYTDTIDVKGISDEMISLHKNHMIYVLSMIFKLFEANSRDIIIKILKEFSQRYKNRELDIEYYRELSTSSTYVIRREYYQDKIVFIKDLGERYKDMIDISYNFINYIIPFLKLLV